ncbi:UNVERIFIED_CONTAM: hypothetical protein PYX00_007920 [Menopon gallinae]|uniref:Winged helix-turn-helix domain-containing protein n=1 Tax=Menopon gallinae TaxID=328185 RepID=A0AAW2HL59_9NEOP
MESKEQIVMTPKGKTSNSTTLWIERKVVDDMTPGDKVHVAGGDHRGIIINKETVEDKIQVPANLSLEFRVFLVNSQTGTHTKESRILRFWFRQIICTDAEQAALAQEFFRELVTPQQFPRDYVGFIKKIMKLLQHGYQGIIRIEIVLTELPATDLPERPPSADDSSSDKHVELTETKLLEVVESYYPNPITVQDLSKEYEWDEQEITKVMTDLQNKGAVKSMPHGAYTRVTQNDTEIKVVKQMPKMMSSKQPTIAIITAQFTEKLAVDAMIDNKETFVRYTTIGESNVYTLGNIGDHQVVCTKLPSVGHTREAMTAAGSTTTRLLGTFQKVEHVFLVGVGGGVPHFTDFNRHVRLGDVVISHSPANSKSSYIFCEGASEITPGKFSFETKSYAPNDTILQEIAGQIKIRSEDENCDGLWMEYVNQGMKYLSTATDHEFKRPSSQSDKLYMAIGEKDLIEVAHPIPQDNATKRFEGKPRIHLGAIGAGREISRNDQIRQQFSQQYNVSAFDSEFGAVIESIIGNCRDSFVCIRGISDYKDGTRKSEWQPYAALIAASVTKAIISALDPVYL